MTSQPFSRLTRVFFAGLLCFLLGWNLQANQVASTTGNLYFDRNSDGLAEAVLNSRGLGLGVSSPSANLEVAGNAIVDSLQVGGTGGSSNLHVHGSFSQSFTQFGAGSNTISSHSTAFADSSAGNVTLILPNSLNVDGKMVQVIKTSTAHQLTIKPDRGKIDNVDLVHVSSGNFSSHRFISSGNQWYELSNRGVSQNLSTYSNNLILHYRLDEVSGNIAYDSVGTHHGNLMNDFNFSGCTTTGVLGNALTFSGNATRVQIVPTSAMVPTGNTMTITAWVKPKSLDGNMTVIRLVNTYDIRVNSNDKFKTIIKNQAGTSSGETFSNDSLSLDTWHHIAVVVDNDSVITYLDGVYQVTDALSLSSFNYTGPPFAYLGDADLVDNVTGNNWAGDLDDIRVYDRAMTAAEIAEMAAIYR
jgi:hypothetical protein